MSERGRAGRATGLAPLSCWLVRLVGLVLLSSPAFAKVQAQSESSEPSEPETETHAELDRITVIAHRQPRRLSEVAGTVTVIGPERLARDMVFEVDDLVRYEPGVEIESGDARFGFSGFRIRGVGGNRTAVLIDGVPVPDRFSVGNFSDSGRGLINLGLTGRVEIMRGPASTLYGSKALGGVVAIDLIDVDDLLTDRDFGLRLSLDGSNDADRYRLTAATALKRDRHSLMLAGAAQRSDQVDVANRPAEIPVDLIDRNQSAILIRLGHATAAGKVRLSLNGLREERDADLRALLGSGRLVNTTRLTGDDRRYQWRMLLDQQLESIGPINQGRWRAWHQRSDTLQLTQDQRPFAPSPIAVFRRFELRQESTGLGIDLESHLSMFDQASRLGYGLELSQTRVQSQRDGLQTSLITGESTRTVLGESFPLRDFPNSQITELGIYLQGEAPLWSGGPTLSPGLRFEYYDLGLEQDTLFDQSFPNAQTTELDTTAWTPRLGLLWPLGPNAEAFAQYARGFRSPPFDDVNIGLELAQFGVRAIANPDLKPERGRTLEAGLRLRGPATRLELVAFRNRYDDFIQSRAPLGFDPVSGFVLFQSINRDRVRIEGGELRLRQALGSGLSAELAAEWTRGEDRSDGRSLSGISPPKAVVELNWISPDSRWETRLIAVAAKSQRHLEDLSGDPLFSPPGYMTVDWLTRCFPRQGLEVGFGLFNLANRRYWQSSKVTGRTPNDRLLPLLAEAGRSARLMLAWSY
jgi:hemoglobin/transferrin/lactoferrin receptor protein